MILKFNVFSSRTKIDDMNNPISPEFHEINDVGCPIKSLYSQSGLPQNLQMQNFIFSKIYRPDNIGYPPDSRIL